MQDRTALERKVAAQLSDANLREAKLACGLSACLLPFGTLLDRITQPSHAATFLWIRIAATLLLLLLLAVLRYSRHPFLLRHPVAFGAAPIVVCGLSIELMISRMGDPGSPYYAGLGMCTLGIGVMYTWRWFQALTVSLGLLTLWVVPILPQVSSPTFAAETVFNNLFFLVLTGIISAISCEARHRTTCRQFETALRLEHTSSELTSAVDRLRSLDRLKSEFFANLSHELRTPITLIMAPIDDLLRSSDDEQARHTLTILYRNAQRLLRLIDNLLDLARLDAQGLHLALSPVSLRDVTLRVVEAATPSARAQGVDLSFEGDEQDVTVWGDASRLEVVIINVVSNALKFTATTQGRIRVRLKQGETRVALEVEDNGPGISEGEREHIFRRFYQSEVGGKKRRSGTGIGLALARELVELHGGVLSYHSVEGGGSLFRISLRKGRAHFQTELGPPPSKSLKHLPSRRWHDLEIPAPDAPEALLDLPRPRTHAQRARILIAEDEHDLRHYLEDVLSRQFDTVAVADGTTALQRVRSERPDLVLSDLAMPGLSGIELCREIKKDPRLKRTPVLLLTARSDVDVTLEGYEAGADDFILKPFHARVLLARVNAHLNLQNLALQLADHARLALAGTLAAGVAHEIRNPINAILNAARVLAEDAPVGMPQKLLKIVDEGAQRIVGIVASLDEHVRPSDVGGLSQCNLLSGIDSSLELLEHRMKGIAVHRKYHGTPVVVGAVSELNQVFLNLLDNAVRAAPGNIWVEVQTLKALIRVSVADDGPGIAPEIEAHLFEPFVTTRPTGEGTGLGLYLCRRIIEDHGGQLTWMPHASGGACFTLELPTEGKGPPRAEAPQLFAASRHT